MNKKKIKGFLEALYLMFYTTAVISILPALKLYDGLAYIFSGYEQIVDDIRYRFKYDDYYESYFKNLEQEKKEMDNK